jgi:hypothetical protein
MQSFKHPFPNIKLKSVSTTETEKIIKFLKPKYSSDYDEISTKLIKISFSFINWLRAGRSGDRIPVGAGFFAHFKTGHEAHPASCTMSTGYSPGVKRPGRGADHPPPPSAEVENE